MLDSAPDNYLYENKLLWIPLTNVFYFGGFNLNKVIKLVSGIVLIYIYITHISLLSLNKELLSFNLYSLTSYS